MIFNISILPAGVAAWPRVAMFLGCMVVCDSLAAAPVKSIVAGESPVNLEPASVGMQVLPGGGPLTLEAAMSASHWSAVGNRAISAGGGPDCTWVRFRLRNGVARDRTLYLRAANPFVDAVDAYVVRKTNIRTMRGGDHLPFARRAVRHGDVVFRLGLKANESVTIYIRYQTWSALQIQPGLQDETLFFAENQYAMISYGAYFGRLLIILLLNIGPFVVFRDPAHLFYILFLAAQFMYQFSFTGLSYMYLWPAWVEWNDVSLSVTSGLMVLAATLFARRFLRLGKSAPRLDRLLVYVSVYHVITTIAAFFVPIPVGEALIRLGAAATIVLAVLSAFLSLRAGFRPARFFLMAWGALFVGLIIFVLYANGFLPEMFLTHHALQLGSIVEIIFFTIAIFDRVPNPTSGGFEGDPAQSKSRLERVQVEDHVQRLRLLMEEDKVFEDDALNLESLAALAGLTGPQLSELLNKRLGTTFSNYLNGFRVEEAKRILLREKEKTVLAVAFEVGFNSKSSFNANFKRICGVSPRNYREGN